MLSSLLLVALLTVTAICQDCRHFPVEQGHSFIRNDDNNSSETFMDHLINKLSGPPNIRIKIVYHPSITSHQEFSNMESNIKQVVARLKSAVKVKKPIDGKLLFERDCSIGAVYYSKEDGIIRRYCASGCSQTTYCSGIAVPNDFLQKCYFMKDGQRQTSLTDGNGVTDTDLVLIASRVDANCGGSTIAYATSCQLDGVSDRPILGMFNICPGYFSQKSNFVRRNVILHEILHILAFSPSLYAFYRDEKGEPRTPRHYLTNLPNEGRGNSPYIYYLAPGTIESDFTTYQSVHGNFVKRRNVMVTPNVKREVRNHFNCSSMPGLFLEDHFDSFAHVEQLTHLTDVMRASANSVMDLTQIDLAVLEDSGWYLVNYTQHDKTNFGRNLGCTFAKSGCLNFINERISKGQSVYPYCTEDVASGKDIRCNSDFTSIIRCRPYYLNFNLNENFQYFMNAPNKGGLQELEDFCPTIRHVINCRDEESTSITTQNNYYLQKFGSSSRCIPINGNLKAVVNNQAISYQEKGYHCYEVKCFILENYFEVIIGNQKYKCTSSSQIILIKGSVSNETYLEGSFICPNFEQMCLYKTLNLYSQTTKKSVTNKNLLTTTTTKADSYSSTIRFFHYFTAICLVILSNK